MHVQPVLCFIHGGRHLWIQRGDLPQGGLTLECIKTPLVLLAGHAKQKAIDRQQLADFLSSSTVLLNLLCLCIGSQALSITPNIDAVKHTYCNWHLGTTKLAA